MLVCTSIASHNINKIKNKKHYCFCLVICEADRHESVIQCDRWNKHFTFYLRTGETKNEWNRFITSTDSMTEIAGKKYIKREGIRVDAFIWNLCICIYIYIWYISIIWAYGFVEVLYVSGFIKYMNCMNRKLSSIIS